MGLIWAAHGFCLGRQEDVPQYVLVTAITSYGLLLLAPLITVVGLRFKQRNADEAHRAFGQAAKSALMGGFAAGIATEMLSILSDEQHTISPQWRRSCTVLGASCGLFLLGLYAALADGLWRSAEIAITEGITASEGYAAQAQQGEQRAEAKLAVGKQLSDRPIGEAPDVDGLGVWSPEMSNRSGRWGERRPWPWGGTSSQASQSRKMERHDSLDSAGVSRMEDGRSSFLEGGRSSFLRLDSLRPSWVLPQQATSWDSPEHNAQAKERERINLGEGGSPPRPSRTGAGGLEEPLLLESGGDVAGHPLSRMRDLEPPHVIVDSANSRNISFHSPEPSPGRPLPADAEAGRSLCGPAGGTMLPQEAIPQPVLAS